MRRFRLHFGTQKTYVIPFGWKEVGMNECGLFLHELRIGIPRMCGYSHAHLYKLVNKRKPLVGGQKPTKFLF